MSCELLVVAGGKHGLLATGPPEKSLANIQVHLSPSSVLSLPCLPPLSAMWTTLSAFKKKSKLEEASLTVQWLRLCLPIKGVQVRLLGLIPGWRAKIPHASRPKNQNFKQK